MNSPRFQLSPEVVPYFGKLLRTLPVLLLVSFVLAISTYVYVTTRPIVYEIRFSYLIALTERDTPSEYRFDGFYALQATDLFGATLAKLIQSPEIVSASFIEAGIEDVPEDPRELARIVSAEKTAPQLVQVAIRYKNREQARRLTEELQAVVDREVDAYHDQAIPAVQFSVSTTDIWEGETVLAAPLISSIVFLAALFLGVNGILFLQTISRSGTST